MSPAQSVAVIGRTLVENSNLLVQDLDVRVVHAATGELLRALTLDLSRTYHPPAVRLAHPDDIRTLNAGSGWFPCLDR